MKRDASPGSVHDAGCLGLVRWVLPTLSISLERGFLFLFLKEEDKQNQTLLLKFESKMISQCKYIALSSKHLGEEFIYIFN